MKTYQFEEIKHNSLKQILKLYELKAIDFETAKKYYIAWKQTPRLANYSDLDRLFLGGK